MYVFWAVLLSHGVTADLEGQPCFHAGRSKIGTCTLLINCASALQEVEEQVLPEICGLAETAPYVCCTEDGAQKKVAASKCVEYWKAHTGKCHLKFDRATNKTDALGKEFPHVATFGYKRAGKGGRKYSCNGALISERFVVTSSNCTKSNTFGDLTYVLLGDLNLKDHRDDSEPQEIKVDRVYLHPHSDLALVSLERDVEYTPNVRPICLQRESKVEPSEGLLVAMWNNARLQRELLHLKECSNDNLCTEEVSSQGSAGDPLQSLHQDLDCMYELVGVRSDKTSVFTRISPYVPWIESIVWP